MSQLDAMASRLRNGAPTVTFTAHGHSMEPLIADGAEVTVSRYCGEGDLIGRGDTVLVTVHGTTYLHKVLAISGSRVQIGNNKGHVNGWTHLSKVWGVML